MKTLIQFFLFSLKKKLFSFFILIPFKCQKIAKLEFNQKEEKNVVKLNQTQNIFKIELVQVMP